MPVYSDVAIIYNPKSTGKSREAALELQQDLETELPLNRIRMLPTKYAGHAETLAYEFARQYRQPLIISVSGDGGYNEVINGALKAQAQGARPICTVVPAGNANDHARTQHSAPIYESIITGEVRRLDVLRLTARQRSKVILNRYAHSYIGFGLTPSAAVELNKRSLNRLVEVWTVIKAFINMRPVRLETAQGRSAYDNIIFSTIPEMAKVLTISKDSEPDDGKFEVTSLRHSNRLRLLLHFLRGTLARLQPEQQTEKYTCRLLSNAPIQMDGEVHALKRHSELTITAEHQLLRTIA